MIIREERLNTISLEIYERTVSLDAGMVFPKPIGSFFLGSVGEF